MILVGELESHDSVDTVTCMEFLNRPFSFQLVKEEYR